MSGASAPSPALVIGIGNRWRRDDGAGLLAAQRLQAWLAARGDPSRAEIQECAGDLTTLIDLLSGRERVFLVDAAATTPEVAVGQVLRLDAGTQPLPAAPPRSTHALGVGQIVELLRALGTLPAALWVYAIGAADFAPGEGLSPAVDAAVDAVVAALGQELSHA
jgi:hydrogenase maturation protease